MARRLITVAAICIALLAGCGGGDDEATGPADSDPAGPATEVAPGDETGSTPPADRDDGDETGATTPTDRDDGDEMDTTGPPDAGDSEEADTSDSPGSDDESPLTFAGHLSAGDCFDDRQDEDGDYDYSRPPVLVDCADPHDNEVVTIHEVDAEPGVPFPSDDETWSPLFSDVCVPAFQDFLGISGEPEEIAGYYVRPEEDEWEDGARSMACILYLPEARLEGSVRGRGDDIVPASFPLDAPRPSGLELSNAESIEDGYSPSDRFAQEAEIDTDGFFGATFESGDVDEVKTALEQAFAESAWTVTLEDHWRGDVATAFYALELEGTELIVEIWELESGDSRLHYFYLPQ